MHHLSSLTRRAGNRGSDWVIVPLGQILPAGNDCRFVKLFMCNEILRTFLSVFISFKNLSFKVKQAIIVASSLFGVKLVDMIEGVVNIWTYLKCNHGDGQDSVGCYGEPHELSVVVFWVLTPRFLVGSYQRFAGTFASVFRALNQKTTPPWKRQIQDWFWGPLLEDEWWYVWNMISHRRDDNA